MYTHHIVDQVQLLISKGFIPKDKQEEAVDLLKDHYWTNKIAISWSADDIIEHARNQEVELDEETAIEMLHSIFHNHDCEYGLTWNTISESIHSLEFNEFVKIKTTKEKDLPLLIGNLKSRKNERALERRIKGIKDWEKDES